MNTLSRLTACGGKIHEKIQISVNGNSGHFPYFRIARKKLFKKISVPKRTSEVSTDDEY